MQTQSSGSEQKYFTTFQTIRRVTGEEGVSGESLENILTSSVKIISVLPTVSWSLHSSLHRGSDKCRNFWCLRNYEQEPWQYHNRRHCQKWLSGRLYKGNKSKVYSFVRQTLHYRVQAFVINPIEVVKIQQQVHPERTLRFVANQVYREAGLAGFGRGFISTLTRYDVVSDAQNLQSS